MLWFHVEAPFAAFRTFTAGWYRPTATFLTPSAAYGLVLNCAGIDSRLREGDDGHDGKTPATLMRSGLPVMRLALGVPASAGKERAADDSEAFPRLQSVYQQLHSYPVGASGRERAPSCRGNKYNITPVRREFLSDLRAVVGIDASAELLDQIRRGLNGEFSRYGVPFLGDNNFLLDRAELREQAGKAYWFTPIMSASVGVQQRAARLTIAIDRADLSRTKSQLFVPSDAYEHPPDAAWTTVGHA